MKQKRKQTLLLCGAAAFAALFLFSGVMLVRQYADQKQSAEAFDQVAALIQEEPAPTETTDESGQEETLPTEESTQPLTAYETYAAVYAQNPDFVGWISIDGTNINYPVMQSVTEPNFYLKHGFDRSYSDYGVPYVQENCMIWVSDNCIVYGHHMKNGTMFSDLCKYEREDFYRKHPTFSFDTLDGFGEYEIVTVFKTVAYSEEGFKYYHFVDAADEAEFDGYIAKCKELALYDTGVSAQYGDKLLTLSTCEYSRTNGRMVVVAKRIDPSPGEVTDHAGY